MNEQGLHVSDRAKPMRLGVIGAVLAAIGLGAGITAAVLLSPPVVSIPRSIAEKILFPIYVPVKLPGAYKFAPKEVAQQEEALIFSIKDGAKTISFSEQAMPRDITLSDFYKLHMTDVKNIQGTPYPAVSGKLKGAENTGRMVSISAEGTWLIISSKDASPEELEFIAHHLKRQ